MNMTDPDRRHLHDLEDQLARMTNRAEKAEGKLADREQSHESSVPDVLWGSWLPGEGWEGFPDSIFAYRTEQDAESHLPSDQGWEVRQVGVSVACFNAMKARAENAEAELAAHRAEAERPIGVGDEVLYNFEASNDYTVGTVVDVQDSGIRLVTFENSSGQYETSWHLRRIGRAVRMPDGSPVPEIGGGA